MTEYHINPAKKLMLRITGPAHAYLVQVLGRDMNAPFSHRHESIMYPSPERLQEEIKLNQMQPATEQQWQELVSEYLQVNKAKVDVWNDWRQKQYENGNLKM